MSESNPPLSALLTGALDNDRVAVAELARRLAADLTAGKQLAGESVDVARTLFQIREPSRSSDELQCGLLRLLANAESGDSAFWRTQKANVSYRALVPSAYDQSSAIEPSPTRQHRPNHASEPFGRLLGCWDAARSES